MAGVRSTARWQKLRAEFLALSTHCARCGQPLRPDLKAPHPLSSTVDHIIPIAAGGDPFDWGNLRAMHYGENASLGASFGNAARRARRRPAASREW